MPKSAPPAPILNCTLLGQQMIEDMVVYAHEERGNITKIHERYIALTGELVSRQRMGQWLHRDPKKRISPPFGRMVALMICTETLRTNSARPPRMVISFES